MAIRDFIVDFLEQLLDDKTLGLTAENVRFYEKGTSAEDDPSTDQYITWQNAKRYNADTNVARSSTLFIQVMSENSISEIMSFNVGNLYRVYRTQGMDAALQQLRNAIQASRPVGNQLIGSVLEKISDLNAVRDFLILRPLNYDNNEVFLQNAIYRRTGDMAVVLHLGMKSENGQILSFKVTREIMQLWDSDEKALMTYAMENTMRLQPPVVCVFDFHNEVDLQKIRILEKDVEIGPPPFAPQTLCTEQEINGAIAGFYPPVQERLFKLIGGDYYMVFTSIHDVHFHPIGSVSLNSIRNILKDTNQNINKREEVLTRNIYRYDGKKKELVIVP